MILLDVMMSEYDGFYFLDNIGKDDQTKVIIISGDLSESTQNKLQNEYTKISIQTIDPNKLIELVKQ